MRLRIVNVARRIVGHACELRAERALRRLLPHADLQLARYVVNVELGIPKRAIARAGRTRASFVARQIGLVEDRRDDPAVDAAIGELARMAA